MKVGTIFAPKVGSNHLRMYGNFVGQCTQLDDDGAVYWNVLEGGKNNPPVTFGNKRILTLSSEDFQDITEIYNSPLYEALK